MNTRKLLTLLPHEAALEERDNMRVALEPFGSKYSHFIFAPIFELEQTAYLFCDDAVFLLPATHLALRKPAFLHSAVDTLELRTADEDKGGIGIEVNATFETKTRWKIRLFSRQGNDEQNLRFGDIVWLRHPDIQVALSAEVSGVTTESFMSLDYDDLDFGLAFKNFGETMHSATVNSMLKSHR